MKRQWIIIVACVAAFAVIAGNLHSSDKAQLAKNKKDPVVSESQTAGLVSRSRQPEHVSVRIKSTFRALIAGETGKIELEARLTSSGNADTEGLGWRKNAEDGVIVWMASPRNSGIAFLDKANPDRPHYHIMVKFPVPAGNISDPLNATVEYTVDSKTKAGKHALWLDIFSELTTPDGKKVFDEGVASLPFEVDTHPRTKLLMLFVVAVAILLFIFEWVRVDVVGILMMVSLPELGLLRAEDAFRGISSNAVIAIIGVMIISYGLNRAGLVSRLIQPSARISWERAVLAWS